MSTPPYVELHCHSAYSFLDGVSLPHELARSAGERGHTALALTDHNSLSGSMEFAQSVADHGVRAIHGAEIDVITDAAGGQRDRSRHLTLLVCDERGWSNLCRIITLAHAHTREGSARRERAEAAVGVEAVIEHAEGLVCLTGCAERSVLGASARRARVDDRAPARRVRRGEPLRRAAAPICAPRSRSQPRVRRARAALAAALRGHRRCPRAYARQSRAAGCVRRAAPSHHARCLRADAAWQPQPCDEHAAGDGQPLRRPSRGGP